MSSSIIPHPRPIELVLGRLRGARRSGNGWLARCPAHDDHAPSLSIAEGPDGRVLLRCHAGCETEAVVRALGLSMRDLFPAARPERPAQRERGAGSGSGPRRKPRATRYELRDPEGRLVAVHVREDGPQGKKLWWERPDGRRGLEGLRVADLPLYAVDRIAAADRAIVVEGEKACEALLRLGLPAVGTVTGAASTPGDDALRPLLGRMVYLWPDHDDPGRDHMERIARRLYALGHTEIRWVTWQEAPESGDAADFVATGATREDVERLLEQAARWKPPEVPDGPELLRDLERCFSRYVVLPPGTPLVLAAWTLCTWLVDVFEITPYLAITSPEKRCGKTTLLGLLGFVVREPLATANISEAALFRVVQELRPTLLIDEAQQLRDRSERSAALHDLLAAGYVRGQPVYRVAKAGDGFRVERYDAFGFKAIAMIGNLTDVLADRSIGIRMYRRAPHEAVARFRRLQVKAETAGLRERLEAWALANEARVREAYLRVEPPAWLNDRASDNWAALWAVVEVADPSRLPELESAARSLEGDQQDLDRESLGVRLLGDIRRVFDENGLDRLETTVLIEELCEDESAPWGDWHGRRLTPQALARLLRPFGIAPCRWREGERVVRGYAREAFLDVFSRYLHSEPSQPSQSSQDAGFGDPLEPSHNRHKPSQDGEPSHTPGESPEDDPGVGQRDTPMADQKDSPWIGQENSPWGDQEDSFRVEDSADGAPASSTIGDIWEDDPPSDDEEWTWDVSGTRLPRRGVPPGFGAACRPRPVPPDVAAEVQRIEDEAMALGWTPEELWQTAGWVSELGLAALMWPGDRVEAVTAEYIAVRRRDGNRTRFYRRPAPGRGDRGFS